MYCMYGQVQYDAYKYPGNACMQNSFLARQEWSLFLTKLRQKRCNKRPSNNSWRARSDRERRIKEENLRAARVWGEGG